MSGPAQSTGQALLCPLVLLGAPHCSLYELSAPQTVETPFPAIPSSNQDSASALLWQCNTVLGMLSYSPGNSQVQKIGFYDLAAGQESVTLTDYSQWRTCHVEEISLCSLFCLVLLDWCPLPKSSNNPFLHIITELFRGKLYKLKGYHRFAGQREQKEIINGAYVLELYITTQQLRI